jgi:purine-cytosine permease-like protein
LLTVSKKNEIQKLLLITIIGTGFTILTSTFLGKEVVKSVTDIMYIVTTTAFVVLTIILVLRFKK